MDLSNVIECSISKPIYKINMYSTSPSSKLYDLRPVYINNNHLLKEIIKYENVWNNIPIIESNKSMYKVKLMYRIDKTLYFLQQCVTFYGKKYKVLNNRIVRIVINF